MSGKRIGYIRVSTIDQNPDRQLQGVELDKKFIDYCSGKNLRRPQFIEMMDWIREDDILIVHSMDRLARNSRELREIVDGLIKRGIQVHFLKEGLRFTGQDDAMSILLLTIMGAYAEFEHAFICERIREGVAIAKKAGKFKGRKPVLDDAKVKYIREQLSTTRRTKASIASEMGIGRTTLYKYLGDESLIKDTKQFIRENAERIKQYQREQ